MADIVLARTLKGQVSKSLVLTGLRGVGKSVLLGDIQKRAVECGLIPVHFDGQHGLSLPSVLIPALQVILEQLCPASLDGAQTIGEAWEDDLVSTFEAVGQAAKANETGVVLFLNDLHIIPETQLACLIMGIHRVAQDGLPVIMIATGLPSLPATMGSIKAYAERAFEFIKVESLPPGTL